MKRWLVCWGLLISIALAGCEFRTPGSKLLPPGSVAPPLIAEEWVGGSPPSESDIKGKVVVVDVWAHWCGPCRAAAPGLVKIYHEFADDDVQFVGLTPDGTEARAEIEGFHQKANLPWPTGMGASKTLNALGVEYLPTVFVIGRDGKVVWNSGLPGTLEDAIQNGLDQEIL